MPRSARSLVVLVGLLALAVAAPAQAQDKWPTKPVRVIIPFTAGGLADTIARVVMAGLSEKLKEQFYIENRPGAGGALGSMVVARAEPDGYTLIVSGVGSHIMTPLTNPKAGYDPLKDFTHIAMLGGTADILAVHPSVNVKTVAEFIKLANSTPGGLTYASSGPGTLAQIGFEYFRLKHNINVRPIPYAGGGGALNDAIAGHVPAIFSFVGEQARAGKLRALAVSTPVRIGTAPDTPTFLELGYPELNLVPWFALSGPKNMSADIVRKLNAEVRDVLKRPEVKARLDGLSIVTFDWDVPTVQRYFADELKRWGEVAKFVDEKTKP
jgi:tripartite-type tricarboxylate transporter receptor subunit TctC